MRASVFFIFIACLVALPEGPAKAGVVETSGPVTTTPANATFYNTTGITMGNDLWVYHQGDDGVEGGGDPNCKGTGGDRIIAYRARITNGVPGPFQRVGRISPTAKSPTRTSSGFWPPACVYPPAHYGPGQIFWGPPPPPPAVPAGSTVPENGVKDLGVLPIDVKGYQLIADVSDAFVFKNWWRAVSSDGLNWTWYVTGNGNSSGTETLTRSDTGGAYTIRRVKVSQPFLEATSNVDLLNPILHAEGNTWWGFFNFAVAGGFKIGAVKVDWSTGSPQIKIASSLAPSWSYTTLPNAKLGFIPAAVANGNAKTLISQGSQFQLWAWTTDVGTYGQHVNCNTSTSVQCLYPGGCNTADGSKVGYLAWGRPFWLNTGPKGDVADPTRKGSGIVWWNVTSGSIGARNHVYSYVRALPSGYRQARMFPFRWNSPTGRRYLFSTTNDSNVCSRFLGNPFINVYVVRTQLN